MFSFTVEMHNEALVLIEDICLLMTNKVLTQLGMVSPDRVMHAVFNQELQREQQYNRGELRENLPKMNQKRKHVYDTIITAVKDITGEI